MRRASTRRESVRTGQTVEATEGPSLLCRRYTGGAGLRAIAADWDELMARSPDASPHMSRAWAEPFVEAARTSGELLTVTVWSGGQLVALLPLTVQRRGPLQAASPVAAGLPSYLGLLLDPRFPTAIAALAADLCGQRDFDLLCLRDVSSADAATEKLVAECGRRKALVRRHTRAVCLRLRPGASFDAYLASRHSRATIRKLGQEQRRLYDSGGLCIRRYGGADITDEILERLWGLQERSWRSQGRTIQIDRPFFVRLMRSVAEAGLARVWLATLQDCDAAFWLGLVHHDALHLVCTAFDERFRRQAVSKVLLMHLIREACGEGILVVDFSHGDLEYKRFLCNEQHSLDRVLIGLTHRGRWATRAVMGAWAVIQRPSIHDRFRRAYRIFNRWRGVCSR